MPGPRPQDSRIQGSSLPGLKAFFLSLAPPTPWVDRVDSIFSWSQVQGRLVKVLAGSWSILPAPVDFGRWKQSASGLLLGLPLINLTLHCPEPGFLCGMVVPAESGLGQSVRASFIYLWRC